MDRGFLGPDYEVEGKAGEGSFSEVFRARSLIDNTLVAAKLLKRRFRSVDEANRLPEVGILQSLRGHPNVIMLVTTLFDASYGFLALVFEHMELNLYEAIQDNQNGFSEATSLIFTYQILNAISFMHSKSLFHRDLKPENCMVNMSTLELKLVDFGSARFESSTGPMTDYIATRWYRAPECILTSGSYGPEVDIWAVGCILYELLTGEPIFPGKTEIDQITLIHAILGTPGHDILSTFNQNPNTQISLSFVQRAPQDLRSFLPRASPAIIDLLKQLLVYNPVDRITAFDALRHPAFDDLRRAEKRYKESSFRGCFPEFLQSEVAATIPVPGPVIQIAQLMPMMTHAKPKILQISENRDVRVACRIAGRRIKAYVVRHPAEDEKERRGSRQQRPYRPAIRIGPAKILKNVSVKSISAFAYPKPDPETIQARLPPLKKV